MRAQYVLSLVLMLAVQPGCVMSFGDFDGIVFWPTTSSFALADRNDLIRSNNSLVPTGRADDEKKMTLYFSGASVDIEEEWRHFSTETLLQLKKDLALKDGLLWENLPLNEVVSGAQFEKQLDATGRVSEEDSNAYMVLGPPSSAEVEAQGFGNLVELLLQIDDANTRPGGEVVGTLEIKRGRGEGQDGEVATGEVTLQFRVPVIGERLGKSNLSLASPIMRCAAREGPTGAGNCRHEPPEGYLGATGLVTGEP